MAAAVAAELEANTCPVHADNEQTVAVFTVLATQWRITSGMSVARTGLDYSAIPGVLGLLEVPRRDRRELFHGLRTMEAAALAEFSAMKARAADG